MVGRGQESPNIILSLLDVTSINQKPQYVMASEQPLLLYRCAYDNLEFIRSRNVLETVKKEISSEISRYVIYEMFTRLILHVLKLLSLNQLALRKDVYEIQLVEQVDPAHEFKGHHGYTYGI